LQESGTQVKRIDVVLDENNQSGQNKNSSSGDFSETGKKELSGESSGRDSDPGQPSSSGSTLGIDYQRAHKKVVEQISDEAISAYA
jgi:hypothetical protein